MKKLYKKTVRTDMGLMIVTVSVLGVVSLAACSINYNDLADGINDLGKSVDHAINGTDAATAAATSGTETDATDPTAAPTEPEATPTPSPTPVPTATPTPTPTPTPAPQRVDMSELTTDTITEGVEIKDETFEESYHDVDDYTQLVKFTGNRIAVEIPDGKNVQTAINLVINGFYNETEGLYKRYSDEAQSAYLLDKENYLAAPYSVNVKFNYSYNGRVLSVISEYTVKKGEEEAYVEHKSEISTFDILTGQYVTPALVAKDYHKLEEVLAQALAQGSSSDVKVYKKEDVKSPVLVVHPISGGTVFAEVYGKIGGELYKTPVDLANYADYLNSYGKIVYKINN